MSWLTNLMRPDLRDMAAYSSARTEAKGFTPQIGVNANEFPWPSFGIASTYCKTNIYPDPQPEALIERLAAYWGVLKDSVLITRGSDEGIDVLIRMFCNAGTDEILTCPPTYGMYEIAARIQNAKTLKVPLTPKWQLDLDGILSSCTPQTKLIFVPSPTAPLGHLLNRDDILALCRARAEKSLVVIDEAYVEFTDSPEGFLRDLPNVPNLVVLRTLSKAHALAGERVGVVIGQPDLIASLRKILAPYPLTQTSVRAAMDALSPCGLIQSAERRKIIVNERERMAKLLLQSPHIVSVFPSVANFILAKTKDAKAVMQQLQRFGILARDRSREIPETVRFSIGAPEENNVVLQALGVAPTEKASDLMPRVYATRRATKETSIDVAVNLDAPDFVKIGTGIGFFDHMLEQLALHGGFGLAVDCAGDLHVDPHHSIEDVALAIGEAIRFALGDKRGIGRYGYTTLLDEAEAQISIDLSGRPYFLFTGNLPSVMLGEMPSEMAPHFFQSLTTAMGAAIHLNVSGDNAHHMVEASFKALGRALRQAFRREGQQVPSTKGVL